MLCLRLPQSALVHLNTIFLPRVLGDGDLALAAEDRRALSLLFWTHSNLLGRYHFTHPDNLQDELRCSAAHALPPAKGSDHESFAEDPARSLLTPLSAQKSPPGPGSHAGSRGGGRVPVGGRQSDVSRG